MKNEKQYGKDNTKQANSLIFIVVLQSERSRKKKDKEIFV